MMSLCRLESAWGYSRVGETQTRLRSCEARLRPVNPDAENATFRPSTMALRLNKLLRSSIHKQKKLFNNHDEDDDDADNISLCSDMDRSARNLADMMMPLESSDMINTQINYNSTFQAYNFVSDDASEDSDISDDDCFGEEAHKDQEPTTLSTSASEECPLGSDDSDKEDHLPTKPAQFRPEISVETQVAGIKWIEGSDETRHVELEILLRPATTSSSSGRYDRSSASSSGRHKQTRKERSSHNDQRVGDDVQTSSGLESGSRHTRRTSSRREAATSGSRHKVSTSGNTSTRMKRTSVRRIPSNRDALLGGLDSVADNTTRAGSDSIGFTNDNHSHHQLRNQQHRRDFVPRRTKSSHCRLQDSNASLDW